MTAEWTFTGEQNDPAGLEYLRARYYEPANGRFLSRDPFMGLVRNPQSLNRYAYALNNPVNLRDPSGLQGGGEVAVATAGGEIVCVVASGGTCVVIVGGASLVAACAASPGCREALADAMRSAGQGLSDIGGGLLSGAQKVGNLLQGLPGPFHEETRQPSEPPPTFNGRGPGGGGSWNPFGSFDKIPTWVKAVLAGSGVAVAAERARILDFIGSLVHGNRDKESGSGCAGGH